jgi:hypothetical protein
MYIYKINDKRCENLQVISRPSPSTKGRSNQHRLFLRVSSHTAEILSDVCLDHPSLENVTNVRGQIVIGRRDGWEKKKSTQSLCTSSGNAERDMN